MKHCLALKNVTVDYGSKRIGPVSASLDWGVHALVGPNGAGKSTLLRAAAGLVEYSGAVHLCDKPSYMPATPSVDPLAYVHDVLRAGLYGSRATMEDAIYWLEELGARQFYNRRFSTLSSGEKRLVCIARALSRRSKIVLLDEPLAFLDVTNQALVLRVLRDYTRALSGLVLVTTHELHYLGFFDSILVLDDGRQAYHGSPSGVDASMLSRVYGIEMEEITRGVFIPKAILEPSVR